MSATPHISITGLGCLSGLGHDLSSHLDAIDQGRSPFRPLGELEGTPAGFDELPASWITPRDHLTDRLWSPASMAAIHAAREAVANAGWSGEELRDTVVFCGTSRGSIAGWIDPWPGRRRFRLMAASNSLHSEPAAAICSQLGIGGEWHTLSSGCCASLDALSMALLWLQSGRAKQALVAAVDLPLAPTLLRAYGETGILTRNGERDPYSENSSGIMPAEGAAAMCLEAAPIRGSVQLVDALGSADPRDPLASAADSPGLRNLVLRAKTLHGSPSAVIPHASGTQTQARSEPAAIRGALGQEVAIHPLKPWTGHTIGASGLLESVILAARLAGHQLPPAYPTVACTKPAGSSLPSASKVFKLASAMGGRHALAVFQSPDE